MKTVWIVAAVMFVVAVGVGGAVAGDRPETKFYEKCIDRKISQCDCKKDLMSSRSVHLQNDARISQMKVDFLQQNRTALVLEMQTAELEMKTHKVDCFLNRKFLESLPAAPTLRKASF
jgi:hypothetical protein